MFDDMKQCPAATRRLAADLVDIHLVVDMTDPSLPPNPKKAVLYRPSATQLLVVLAAICKDIPPESVMLIYIAASGDSGQTTVPHKQISGSVRTSVKLNSVYERGNLMPENYVNGKGGSSHLVESSLLLGIFYSQWMLPLVSCLLTSVTGALDVYTVEPPPKDNSLVNHEKVTVTLHLGASTMEAQEGVAIGIDEAVVGALKGELAVLLHSFLA